MNKASAATVVRDRNRRTGILIEGLGLIQLNVEEGLSVQENDDKRWSAVPEYPVEKAARLYAGYARTIGATEEVMTALRRFTKITDEEIDMATAKRNAAPAVKKAAGKSTAVKNEKETLASSVRTGTKAKDLPTGGTSRAAKKPAAKKPVAKKAPAKKAVPAKGKDKAERAPRAPGSGALIRELLLKGKDTDQILAEVHKKFPESKAGPADVSWNRGRLRKEGHKNI
jgi:hypothetical protein